MTREEAKGNLIHALRWNDMPKKEALEMAIQALSQEPCPYSTKDGFCQYEDIAETIPTEKPMCDRNICISNEYNGIGCDKCIVNKVEQKPCKDTELVSVRQELLDRGDEVVSFRQLVERFEEVEEVFKGVPWNLRQIYNNFNILIGEKPCIDAISRQDALRAFMYATNGERLPDYDCDNYPVTYDLRCIKKTLRALPPVNLQPKTGYWISLDDFRGKYNENGFKCSECGEHSDFEENFCPNCGCRMFEPQESEG